MKTYTLYLSLLLLLGSSCVTQENDFISKYCPGSCTVIKGNIATANGTVPLSGIKLEATWSNVNLPKLSGGTVRRKAVTQTDADGNYELRFLLRDDELVDGRIFIETAIDEGKFITCGASQPAFYMAGDLPRDTTLVRNYVLPRRATLALELQNREAISSGDAFSTIITYKAGINRSNCVGGVVNWSTNTSQSVERDVPAEQPVVVETYRTKNGVRTTAQDTLLLAPGQHLTYQLSY
ncbi:hypothetical protein ACXYMU_12500 [Pontibacter sp. CAU 1760]